MYGGGDQHRQPGKFRLIKACMKDMNNTTITPNVMSFIKNLILENQKLFMTRLFVYLIC